MGELTTKLWPIVKREYLERVRTRWFLIATIFAPLIFAIVLIVPARLSHQAPSPPALSNIIVIDATNTGLGTRVALNLASATVYALPQVRQVAPDSISIIERDATAAIAAHRFSGYIVLDSATLHGHSAHYAGRRDDSSLDMQHITHAVRDAVLTTRLAERGFSSEQIDALTPFALTITTEHINTQVHDADNPFKLVLAAFVAFFLYMSIVLFGQSMLSGVMEEKLTRVSEIVLSSVRPSTLLAGKVIGISAVGLTQQAIWLLGSATLLSLRTTLFGPQKNEAISALTEAALHVSPTWIALVVLFFLLGFTFFGSLYAAVGATVNSESEARQAAQPVMLTLVMTVVLIQPVLSDPSSTLARTLSLIPFSSPILMPLRMSISSVPATEIIASVCILTLSCAAAVWIAARIYRVALLMYGKRPTLREMGRWIREG